MAHGRIRAIGASTSLKTKFGAGYKISIIAEPSKSHKIKALVHRLVPGAKLEDDSAGALLYQFPNSCLSYVSSLVKALNQDPYAKAWGLSQTTLEQVFLSVIRAVDPTDEERPLKLIRIETNDSLKSAMQKAELAIRASI